MLACIHGSDSAGSLSPKNVGDGNGHLVLVLSYRRPGISLLYSRFWYGALEPRSFVSSLYKHTTPRLRERQRRAGSHEDGRSAVAGGDDEKFLERALPSL